MNLSPPTYLVELPMFHRFFLFTVMAFTVGCTHIQLERSTVKQTGTWTDLQYQQVLDNLAMFCKNPSAMPYFGVAGTGVTQVSDNGNISPGILFHPFLGGDLGGSLSGAAGRQVSEQWSVATTTDPSRLDVIRCLFRMSTADLPRNEYDKCVKTIREFYGIQENPSEDKDWPRLKEIKSGWLNECSKKDVPRDACYVGHYCDLYVWITPDHVRELTELTLAVLDVATADPAPSVVEHYDVAKCKDGYHVKRYVCRVENPPCDTDLCTKEKVEAVQKLIDELDAYRKDNKIGEVKATAQTAIGHLRDVREQLKSHGASAANMRNLDATINGLADVRAEGLGPQDDKKFTDIQQAMGNVPSELGTTTSAFSVKRLNFFQPFQAQGLQFIPRQ